MVTVLVLVIILAIGVVFEPTPMKDIVVTKVESSNLEMVKPYKFTPFEENGYLLVEDDNLGVIVYAKTYSELVKKVHNEIFNLHKEFLSIEPSPVKDYFNKNVRELINPF